MCGALLLRRDSVVIFNFTVISAKRRKPKWAAAKSYSKLVTANRNKKKGDTGTGHAGDEEEGGLSSAETRIHLLLFQGLITGCCSIGGGAVG